MPLTFPYCVFSFVARLKQMLCAWHVINQKEKIKTSNHHTTQQQHETTKETKHTTGTNINSFTDTSERMTAATVPRAASTFPARMKRSTLARTSSALWKRPLRTRKLVTLRLLLTRLPTALPPQATAAFRPRCLTSHSTAFKL